MAAKIIKFDILLKYFIFDIVFYPKPFVLCPKIVLPLEFMVLAAIYILIIPGYYLINGNKCPFSP